MAADKQFPLALVIKAVDKATGPLRAINEKIKRFTAPFRVLGNSVNALGKELGFSKEAFEKIGAVGGAIRGVGQEVFNLGAKLFAMAGVQRMVSWKSNVLTTSPFSPGFTTWASPSSLIR